MLKFSKMKRDLGEGVEGRVTWRYKNVRIWFLAGQNCWVAAAPGASACARTPDGAIEKLANRAAAIVEALLP